MNYRQVLNRSHPWERHAFNLASQFDYITNKARRKANRRRYQAKKMRATGQHMSMCFTTRIKHHSSRRFINLHQRAYN